jgi:penicillin-binding protein 1A
MAFPYRLFWRLFKWLSAMVFAGLTAGALLLGGLYLYLNPELPAIDRLQDVRLQEPLRVYTRDGELLAVYGSKRRQPLQIENVPPVVRNAFVAAEDDRFYDHPGVDWMGIARAGWNLVLTGDKGQGGSTITMQVARNFFLSREKTYLRKLNEILLALKIERELSKPEILELYINKIYLGMGAYGLGAAAQVYYGKTVDALTVPEMAMIAGLPKAPSRYNPASNPQLARDRRNYVLRRMAENAMIDADEREAARSAPITAVSHSAPIGVDAPFVGEMARLEAVQRFGKEVYTGGYSVYTSIDSDKQRAATASLRRTLLDYASRHGYQGPLATLDAERVRSLEAVRERLAAPRDSGAATDAPSDQDGVAAATATPGMLGPRGLDIVLAQHEGLGNLQPAVVIAVSSDRAIVYRGGGLARLPWSKLQWAAPRLREGAVGPSPEQPGDVLGVGDVIYVAPVEQSESDGEAAPPVVRLAQAPEVEGALVALDPADGAIRALSGGFAFERSKFNRAVQAQRQPGSNFKPFVYSAALNKEFTPATLVNDAPVVFDDPALEDTWRPENYSGRVFGPTRLREGLVHSRNLVSIRVLLSIGISYTVDYVQRFGFPEEQLPHDLTLALGSASLSPLQVARGYATFANMGFRVRPYLVTRMATNDGEVVYRANPARACPEPCPARARAEADAEPGSGDAAASEDADQPSVDAEQHLQQQDRPGELAAVGAPDIEVTSERRFAQRAIPARNAYIVRSFLRDVARRGTGRGTRVLDRDDLGGKTGTTDDQLDAWFSGFNSSLVATAWVGFDQNNSLGQRETGARAALPMWIDFMRTGLAGTPRSWPDVPAGMVTVRIDPETGDYAGPQADKGVFEIFRAENAPERKPSGTVSGGNSGSGEDDGSSGDRTLF